MSPKPLLLLPVLQLLLWGQAPVGQGSAAQLQEGSIEGRVVNAITGEPVGKATVSTPSPDAPGVGRPAPPAKSTVTDSAGHFVLNGLPPRRYSLIVLKPGFVSLKGAGAGVGSFNVGSGERVTGVVLRLNPGGVVTGRIVDEDGEPVVRAWVRLWRYAVAAGRRRIEEADSEGTNDLGEYRFFELAPGRYYVSASRPQTDTPYRAEEKDFGVTYYPGVLAQSSAQPVDVRAGDRIAGIEFVMRTTRVARVSGRVTGVQDNSIVVVMMTPRAANSAAPPIANSFVNRENGSFSFKGVLPGSYTVTAREMRPGSVWSARTQLEVGDSDVENLSLAFLAPVSATGRLRMDGSGSVPEQLPLSLMPRDPEKLGVEIPPIVKGAGGTFQIRNASPEVYVVQTNSRAVYVKKVRMGNTETSAPILDLTNGAFSDLEILLGSKPARVTGAVLDPKTGAPAANAVVVLIPAEPERRDIADLYRQARTDDSGRFVFAAIPPGAYTAYAWPDASTAAYMEPDFMKDFEAKGVNVDASEGRKPDIQMNLLTVDASGQ